MKWIGAGVGVLVGIPLVAVGAGVTYVMTMLPDAGPVAEVTLPTDEATLARGEYLFHSVMVCSGCHSGRDLLIHGHPLHHDEIGVGGNRFGDFDLVVYSKNITPTALGSWSDGQLVHALTTGVNPENYPLFPIMPWGNYAKASVEDVQAVAAYTRTLAPKDSAAAPERSLPGPLPLLVNTFPTAADNPAKAPDPSDEVAYGEYLTTIASCGDCHTPKEQGAPIPGMTLAGGFDFIIPDSPEVGLVRTANITPDKGTGIGGWSREQFIGKFKSALDDPRNGAKIEPGHTWTMMPWTEYAEMTEADLGAIYAYLMTVEPVSNEVVRFVLAEGQEAKGWPEPVTPPAGAPPRGLLGSLCDTVTTDDVPPDAVWAEEGLPPKLVKRAAERAKHRGFEGFGAFAEQMAGMEPEARKAFVARGAKAYSDNMPHRCAPLMAKADH